MRVGIIDLGTNSVRFDICELHPKFKVRHLYRNKLMIRLGQGVFVDKKISAEASKRAIEALLLFKAKLAKFGVKKTIAFGTSALREARNRKDFLQKIEKSTGIRVRVISGEEEARLIALGILTHESLARGNFGLLDIGGGSTEISLCRNKNIAALDSLDLGVARLQQVFLKSVPPKFDSNSKNPIQELRKHIQEVVGSSTVMRKKFKLKRIIGSSGTVRALARICGKKRLNTRYILRKSLSKTVEAMSTMSAKELLDLPGLQEKRVDLILAGGVLLEEVMKLLDVKRVFVTDYSLRDGIIVQECLPLLYAEGNTSSLKKVPKAYRRTLIKQAASL